MKFTFPVYDILAHTSATSSRSTALQPLHNHNLLPDLLLDLLLKLLLKLLPELLLDTPSIFLPNLPPDLTNL